MQYYDNFEQNELLFNGAYGNKLIPEVNKNQDEEYYLSLNYLYTNINIILLL